ncbi:glycoside hydrolase family 79 protein [Aulographum hederae CBS 113979]|uniref:Glycoside hydrolase family 79 protein n=1 Tax=Aulographum hederae CBS 113979 TaxID=1176131 RepID=A0A6G1H8H4_9PEZI|nr:glycoside hydrolase family 79 protein [Aulographum hederae CBS 113979]
MSVSLVLLAANIAFVAAQISLSPPATAARANGISQVVDSSFAGFGIEPSNLFSFTGGDEPNQMSINLMTNLADFAGGPASVRLGGNSGDNMIFDARFDQFRMLNNPNPTGQGAYASDLFYYGPTYYEALNRFPTGTPVTFGLNLAYSQGDYLERIVEAANASIAGMTNVKLFSFEIGNEPDLYLENGFRNNSNWGGQVYTQEWLTRARAVYEGSLRPAGLPSNFFEPATPASTIAHPSFEIATLVQDGITRNDSVTSTGYVSAWNQHDYFYFVDVSKVQLTLDYLMMLDNTNSQFAYWEQQVGIALTTTRYPYYLREMASAGPIGLQNISDTFGASLWTLNFFLYAATLNISAVGFHMTDNSWAAPWQPIRKYNLDPYVRPSYYAFAATAQLIGNGNGTTQVTTLIAPSVPPAYNGRVRTYATYAAGNLTSIILINSKLANASVASKPSLTFSISMPAFAGQTLFLSTLIADGADSTSGTLWNGVSFESNDGEPSDPDRTLVSSLVIPNNGTVSIRVRDSSAVVANLGSLLGENVVLLSNGTAAPNSHRSAAPSPSESGTAVISGVASTAVALATSNVKKSEHPSPIYLVENLGTDLTVAVGASVIIY